MPDGRIEHAKSELERMIDLAPQIMLLTTSDGAVLRTNKALLDLLGLTDFQQVLGRTIDDIFPCCDASFTARLLKSGAPRKTMTAELAVSGGSNRVLRFAAVVSGDSEDACVIIVDDVTSVVREAADREREHKRDATRAVGGALMHNLNQPLTVILIRARLMQLAMEKKTMTAEEMKGNLEDITRLTEQIAQLVKGVAGAREFVTVPYSDNTDILDIEQSSAGSGPSESSAMNALNALLCALDRHDPGAVDHARRTSEYVSRIAEALSLNEQDRAVAGRAALLHDIGKIGVPDSIIRKAGPLDADEMELMKTHVIVGRDILGAFPFLSTAAETAFSHHERFDGSGYPRGISGKDIPLVARMLAVADTYDALCSSRPYRDPIAPEDAVRAIGNGAGTQFDPEIVAAFDRAAL